MPDALEFQSRMEQLDALLQEAEQTADPASGARLRELVSGLLEVHGEAIQRILEHINHAGDAGERILGACSADPIVTPVLVLHGLHPQDVESRVRLALEKVRPYAASHGGNVELLGVSGEGVAMLRLEGSCHGCPSSRVTLRSTIETEIFAAAPEIVSIEVSGLVEEAPPPAGFVPVGQMAINGSISRAAAS